MGVSVFKLFAIRIGINLVLRVSIVLFLLTLISCSEPSKPHAPIYQKPLENPPLKEEKTLVLP